MISAWVALSMPVGMLLILSSINLGKIYRPKSAHIRFVGDPRDALVVNLCPSRILFASYTCGSGGAHQLET